MEAKDWMVKKKELIKVSNMKELKKAVKSLKPNQKIVYNEFNPKEADKIVEYMIDGNMFKDMEKSLKRFNK